MSNEAKQEASPPNGGRTWWAHLEFTRINIEPLILYKKIEELGPFGGVQINRRRLISRCGGSPNRRLYSRLNCEALS